MRLLVCCILYTAGIRIVKDVKFSDHYRPTDFHKLSAKIKRNAVDFDQLLLAVVALDRLELRGGFTSHELIASAGKVVNEELANLLKEMIKCLL